MDSSFKNVSALWLEDNKLFWKESTYTKYLFISKNMDKIICDCSLEKINSKIVQQTVNKIPIYLFNPLKTLYFQGFSPT